MSAPVILPSESAPDREALHLRHFHSLVFLKTAALDRDCGRPRHVSRLLCPALDSRVPITLRTEVRDQRSEGGIAAANVER